MTISAMRKKCVVLSLALCLVLSSFHEVSCQVDGSTDFKTFEDQEFQSNYVNNLEEEEEEGQSIKRKNESEINWESSSVTKKETSSSSSTILSWSSETEAKDSSLVTDNSILSETVSSQSSSSLDEVNRLLEAHGLSTQAGSDAGHESTDAAFENDAKNEKRMEELERRIEEVSESKVVAEEELTKSKTSKLEMREAKLEGNGRANDESAATSSYESKKSIGGSVFMGSIGLGHSVGAWLCVNQDKNGVKEGDDSPIVIPKYEIDEIIKEESISQGSTSKTSSLIASLTQIVDKHKNEKWSNSININTVKNGEALAKSETIERLKVTLKKYRTTKVRDLVTRSDFEEILTMAARYEELSSASVSFISRLTMYRSVIIEGRKASQRVQHAQARARLLKAVADEKQTNVDAEFAAVKALAQRGDMLKVKIFAIKKLVLKLEEEKEEVEIDFEKSVRNLSGVLEEASLAYEEYHAVVRKWKEEQAAVDFSTESIEHAEMVWVQFLNTLDN